MADQEFSVVPYSKGKSVYRDTKWYVSWYTAMYQKYRDMEFSHDTQPYVIQCTYDIYYNP